jgi:hypothetical protein
LKKEICIGLLLLVFILVGVKVVPGIAGSEGPEKITLTLEQAVEMAIANNPQVGMASAAKKKKDITYQQAKNTTDLLSSNSIQVGFNTLTDRLTPSACSLDCSSIY